MGNTAKKILTVAIVCSVLLGCKNQKTEKSKEISLEPGLKYEILRAGHGETIVEEGDEVVVHERMGYRNGTELHSTKGMENLPKFLIGGNQAIKGVDQGVREMKLGEVRKLIVPPSLSKRKQYPPFLSPDSILVYEIEVMEIIKPTK